MDPNKSVLYIYTLFFAFNGCVFGNPTETIKQQEVVKVPVQKSLNQTQSTFSRTIITSTDVTNTVVTFSPQERKTSVSTNLQPNIGSLLKLPVSPAINSDVGTFRVKSEDGVTCILMTVDALVSIGYQTKINTKEEADSYIYDKTEVSGDCTNEDTASMILKWNSFVLTFVFEKTPGGERWFVSNVELDYSTSERIFKHINHENEIIHSNTLEATPLFPTPVGRSFTCQREIMVRLFDEAYPDIQTKLLLRKLKVEPFLFKNENFGPEYYCSDTGFGSFRSETAPFVFGTLLVICAAFTVAGYAGYRYFKVNKVQYDTME